jgi:hypothetical protein
VAHFQKTHDARLGHEAAEAILAGRKSGFSQEAPPCDPCDSATFQSCPTSAGASATASRWWRLFYLDREPLEVACSPEATHAEILERHPAAVTAEPFAPAIRHPEAALTAGEDDAIRAWLASIEETDPATIAEVIELCRQDAEAREYFLSRAAAGGEIKASRSYEPIRDLPRRCEGFKPDAADADQRTGRERWPGLGGE